MLKTKMTLAAGAVLMGLAVSAPQVQAGSWSVTSSFGSAVYSGQTPMLQQVHHPRGCEMSRKQIRRSLRHRGFRKIKFVRERANKYVVHARGPHREKVRLVVGKQYGRILRYKVRRHWR
ncbi:hypothetical protein [Pseudovibrio exalbescens]|uniref:PepSY domain-containing protein n=1 Tax=Pseudovibrio exalbescens TaxID=197461 RepID=A0A1U7JH23_9HYPH|nr:hypothetical protein [Pseudovibrio exalbescens]OKL44017.1 hypothetical protein A3843_10550 [Pseudovibrio exalbescens]